jgi:hypothetical protein
MKMQLNGEPCLPDGSKPDRYLISLPATPEQTLHVEFAATPKELGSDRELRVTVPEVLMSRVDFATELPRRQPDVFTRRGGQTPDFNTKGFSIKADLGWTRTLGVRWREQLKTEGNAQTITVKEGTVWDVKEDTVRCDAAFAYRVEGGNVDSIAVQLPAGLVTTSVTVRALDLRTAGVGMRDWSSAVGPNGTTKVTVAFQEPIDGEFLVLVRTLAKDPTQRSLFMTSPLALDVKLENRESLLALRLFGVQLRDVSLANAIDYPADALLKDFPAVPEWGFDQLTPNRVVRRQSENAIELSTELSPPLRAVNAASTTVTLGAWAEVEGEFRAQGNAQSYAEFEVPMTVTVRDVRTAGLLGWCRNGRKIQLWLRIPVNDLTVRWSGWSSINGEEFTLPAMSWPDRVALQEPQRLVVQTTPETRVTPLDTTGLTPVVGAAGQQYTLSDTRAQPRFGVVKGTALSEPSGRPFVPVAPPQPATLEESPQPTPEPVPEAAIQPTDRRPTNTWLWHVIWGGFFGLYLFWVVSRKGVNWPEAMIALGLLALLLPASAHQYGIWLGAAVMGVGVLARATKFSLKLLAPWLRAR